MILSVLVYYKCKLVQCKIISILKNYSISLCHVVEITKITVSAAREGKQNNSLAPFSSTVTKKAKQQARENILSQINGVGANVDSIKTLQDVIWAKIH